MVRSLLVEEERSPPKRPLKASPDAEGLGAEEEEAMDGVIGREVAGDAERIAKASLRGRCGC